MLHSGKHPDFRQTQQSGHHWGEFLDNLWWKKLVRQVAFLLP